MRLWLQDVRYAFRMLRKNVVLTLVILASLAIGIGANSAIFGVVDALLLRPLPYPHPDRLAAVWLHSPGIGILRDWPSPGQYVDIQNQNHSFEQMALAQSRTFTLTGRDQPERVNVLRTQSSLLTMFGAKALLGRTLLPEEDRPGKPPVAILSNSVWRRLFNSDPAIVGRSITLDGNPFTVVGILPRGFMLNAEVMPSEGPMDKVDIFLPLPLGSDAVQRRGDENYNIVVLLKHGVSVQQAQADIDIIASRIREKDRRDLTFGMHVVGLQEQIVGDVRRALLVLLGSVALVLLIACANVANLLLVRSAARRREFAIRSALGASRTRMVRQLLTESVLLAMTGGILGLIVAKLGVRLMFAEFPQSLPRDDSIGVNLTVLFFAFGISLVVGIAFGLAPALKSSRADMQGSLKSGDRGSTRAHPRGQSALVLVLLVDAGLLLRTIGDLRKVNPGFNPQHVITFKVGLSPSLTQSASSIRIAYQQLLDRIRQIPGVEAADFTNIVPLSEQDNGGPFWVGPQESTSMQDAPHALYFETGPDYLQTMEIPLLRGRFFTPADTPDSGPVVVINSALAKTYFRDQDPVGHTITVAHWHTARVIGVVGSVRHWGLGDPGTYNPSQIYISFYQLSDQWIPAFARALSVAVRTPLDVATIMPAVRNVVYGTGKDQPVYDVRTTQQIVSESMSSQRLPMVLLAVFATLALLLASVGIYGVISYSVTQRVQEIGVRMALGAEKRQIFQMVIGQGLRMAVVGLTIGAAAALILTRLLLSFSHLLYGVGPRDPITFASVSLVLTGSAVLACYIPARRASRVDPMVALRDE